MVIHLLRTKLEQKNKDLNEDAFAANAMFTSNTTIHIMFEISFAALHGVRRDGIFAQRVECGWMGEKGTGLLVAGDAAA